MAAFLSDWGTVIAVLAGLAVAAIIFFRGRGSGGGGGAPGGQPPRHMR